MNQVAKTLSLSNEFCLQQHFLVFRSKLSNVCSLSSTLLKESSNASKLMPAGGRYSDSNNEIMPNCIVCFDSEHSSKLLRLIAVPVSGGYQDQRRVLESLLEIAYDHMVCKL